MFIGEWEKGDGDVRSVSALASVFGFLGIAPFVLVLGLAALLLLTNAAQGLPTGYLVTAVPVALAVCFAVSAGNLLAWGILRALCEIEHSLQLGRCR